MVYNPASNLVASSSLNLFNRLLIRWNLEGNNNVSHSFIEKWLFVDIAEVLPNVTFVAINIEVMNHYNNHNFTLQQYLAIASNQQVTLLCICPSYSNIGRTLI